MLLLNSELMLTGFRATRPWSSFSPYVFSMWLDSSQKPSNAEGCKNSKQFPESTSFPGSLIFLLPEWRQEDERPWEQGWPWICTRF